MRTNERMWAIAAAIVAVLTGCQSSLRCDAGAVERNGMCLGSCNTNSPPCVQADGGVLESDGGASDGAMDASEGAVDGGPACEAGASVCSGACVDTQSSAAHCGRCGMACSEGPGERASCVAGQCQSACVTGFERVGMACEALVPRLIGPMSTSYVSSQRPTLRWSAPMGVDGAQVEVCSSRDCATIEQSATIGSGATSWRVERALSAGVHYWRVRGRVGSVMGTRASAVWEFVVGARDRATDTQWGTLMDVNGDGFGDVVSGANYNGVGWGGIWYARWGAMSGLPAMDSWSSMDAQMSDGGVASVASAGDIDGDGFGDVLLGAAEGRNAAMVATGSLTILFGSASGLVRAVQVFGEADGDWFGAAVSALGDINGDGYGDVIVGAPHASAPAIQAGKAYVFLGSPTGLQSTPALVLRGARAMVHFGATLAGAHDVNGDGRPDLVIASPDADDPSEGELQVGAVAYFEGDGTSFPVSPTRVWTRVERVGEPAGGYRVGISVARPGDVNGDGFGDLVLGSDDERLRREVLLLRGASTGATGAFERVTSAFGEARRVGASVDLGDVTGDGLDDCMFTSSEQGSVTSLTTIVRAGVAAGAVDTVAQVVAVPGLRASILGDVDGDGRRECAGVSLGNPGGPLPSSVRVIAGRNLRAASFDWSMPGGWIR